MLPVLPSGLLLPTKSLLISYSSAPFFRGGDPSIPRADVWSRNAILLQCLSTEETSVLHFIAWSSEIPTELGILFLLLVVYGWGLNGAFQLGSGTQLGQLRAVEFSEFLSFLFHRHTLVSDTAALEIPGSRLLWVNLTVQEVSLVSGGGALSPHLSLSRTCYSFLLNKYL